MSSLRALVRVSAFACLLSLLVAPLASQAQGPGLPNLTYTSAEVFKPLSTIHSFAGTAERGQGAVVMHDGYMLVIYAPDSGRAGGGFSFYDISNPRSPVLVTKHDESAIREASASPTAWAATTRWCSRFAASSSGTGPTSPRPCC